MSELNSWSRSLNLNTQNILWKHPTIPVIADEAAQDYLTLQTLLEKTIGMKRARWHPLYPPMPPMGGGTGLLHTGTVNETLVLFVCYIY